MAALIVGESVPDVAAAFNVPPTTVRSWLGEARAHAGRVCGQGTGPKFGENWALRLRTREAVLGSWFRLRFRRPGAAWSA